MTTPVPLHRRSITVEAYDEPDVLRVVGRLRDERPWSEQVPVLHDMELAMSVSLDGLVITAAKATMHAFPHDECPFISPKFAQLEGLSISRGFTRSLRELFAGVSGCQHLHELARVCGPAVFQAATSLRARARSQQEAVAPAPAAVTAAMRGTCHVWAPGGPGEQKIELGWRPDGARYPAPAADSMRDDG
jgi:hypothetical protein